MSEIISLSKAREKRENTSESKSPSMPNIQSVLDGEIPTDPEERGLLAVFMVVERARVNPYTTKSEFARLAATEVALAASEGLISTRIEGGLYTNRWMITAEGLEFLEEMRNDYGGN